MEKQEVIDEAKRHGYSEMFYTPEKKEIQSYIEKYLNAIPSENGSRMAAVTLVYAVINNNAIDLAKAMLIIKKHGLEAELET